MKATNQTATMIRFLFTGATLAAAMPALAQTSFTGAAADVAGITQVVTDFRTRLGTLNANNPGSVGSGRREINWDGAPDAASSPNLFPGGFFNAATAPRARGAIFSTPGTSFQVSANAASGQGVRYDNINPTYSTEFAAFSPQRLFAAIGSNICDVEFRVPGEDRLATSHGFGVVFTDVDLPDTTQVECFDIYGRSIARVFAPVGPTGSGSLSFVGIAFWTPAIARVRITCGTAALGPNENIPNNVDLVVMDDFIYGEPIAVPPPADPCPGDANGDRRVDQSDLGLVLAYYGVTCP